MSKLIITVEGYETILRYNDELVYQEGDFETTKEDFLKTFGDKGFEYPMSVEDLDKYIQVYERFLLSKEHLEILTRSTSNPENLSKKLIIDDVLIQELLMSCTDKGVMDPGVLGFIEAKLPKGKELTGFEFVALTTLAYVYYSNKPKAQ